MSDMLNNNPGVLKMVTGFLNGENNAVVGAPGASPSGSIIQSYGGLLGGKISLTAAEALLVSLTTVGTLYGGVYQMIQIDPNAAGTVARGTVLFWKDLENYIVTPDVADATITGFVAGIAVCTLTKGNYGFMQISGKASVKCKAALTKAAASGDLMIVDQTPTATADVLADATGLTSVTAKGIVGVALEAPANGAVKKVLLRLGGMGI